MSLVNDMLRDLEARRAAPDERERLAGLQPVDEAGATRRQGRQLLRRGLLLVGLALPLLLGLGWWYGLRPIAAPVSTVPAPVVAAAPTAVEASVISAPTRARLLDVLPQNDGQRLILQLLLDRSVGYKRVDQGGFISLQLDHLEWSGGAREGRVERDGKSLSWRVEAKGDGVQVLLVGMADRLELRDRLEPAGDRWQLWLEVPLSPSTEAAMVAPSEWPEAVAEDAPLPDWATRPVPKADEPVVHDPEPSMVDHVGGAPASRGPVEVRIASHPADPLALARQAIAEQRYVQAIEQLEALERSQPGNPEVIRWLARAYLSAGETERLLAWLPARLDRHPNDIELRMLLARGQLLAGEREAAITTLRRNAPELSREPLYHALLAALYQQVGDWSASAALYGRLVALRPTQGTWQLGLAIALEQLDQPAQAARRYRLALQGQDLDTSARLFAAERAAILGEGK